MASFPRAGTADVTIKGENSLAVDDVLVGEVWLGSGQSNMAMEVKMVRNSEQEQATASWPQIRMFTVLIRLARYAASGLCR